MVTAMIELDPETAELLAEIDAFLAESGMAKTTFGQRAVKNWKLHQRLCSGGSVTLPMKAKIRAFIAEQRARPRMRGIEPRVAA